MQNSKECNDLPEPFQWTQKSLSNFFDNTDINEFIRRKERELWRATSTKHGFLTSLNGLLRRVDQASTQWACISAKSQREKNFKGKNGVSWKINMYDNLTTITPHFERIGHQEPPDRSGKHIFQFSKRSRQRLMNKARRLNKSKLPKPYFVTLTYRKNYRDPKGAKDHLNAFFQRWRRKDEDFAYFWKMEPQKRGAVHFHLALFITNETQENVFEKRKKVLSKMPGMKESYINALRLEIQQDWASVTKDIDGHKFPVTTFDYIRKKRKKETYKAGDEHKEVKTVLANPKNGHITLPDTWHELYGTNVRNVDNWKQFLGYIYKYCGKEVKNDFGKNVKTGRYWGFSYNFDFSPKHSMVIDHADVETVQEFTKTVNAITFHSLIEHLKQNVKRKEREVDDPRKLMEWKQYYRNIYEQQKRRYVVNNEKIRMGGMVQNEVSFDRVKHLIKFTNGQSVATFFGIRKENVSKK